MSDFRIGNENCFNDTLYREPSNSVQHMSDTFSLLPTHVDGLDRVLGGGIPRGSIVLVAGNPGTMKTSLVFNIMYHNAKRGSRALYVTLEQTTESLRLAMKRFGLADFKDHHIYILDIGKLRLELNKKEVTRDWIEILLEMIREAVNINAYDILAIDSLDALYSLMGLTNPRRELFHFFSALRTLGLTTFLISEIPFGSTKLTQFGEDFLADGIVHLKHVEVTDVEMQLRLRCVKMRMVKNQPGYLALNHDGNGFYVTGAPGKPREGEQRVLLRS